MKIAMALVIASPPVFYILETMWTVAFQVLGRILIATTFRRTRHRRQLCVRSITRPIPTTRDWIISAHGATQIPYTRTARISWRRANLRAPCEPLVLTVRPHMDEMQGVARTGALGLFSLAFRHETVLRCASKGFAI
jgi:hypothetical protein